MLSLCCLVRIIYCNYCFTFIDVGEEGFIILYYGGTFIDYIGSSVEYFDY